MKEIKITTPIEIPKDWRRLAGGERRRSGDRFAHLHDGLIYWYETGRIGKPVELGGLTYIRKLSKSELPKKRKRL